VRRAEILCRKSTHANPVADPVEIGDDLGEASALEAADVLSEVETRADRVEELGKFAPEAGSRIGEPKALAGDRGTLARLTGSPQ
jgi:hypothetical protein